MSSTLIRATAPPRIWPRWLVTALDDITGGRLRPWHKRPCPVLVNRREAGRFAEKAAACYLREQGLEVLRLNYRTPGGEIDVVARDGRTLVMIEVRSRSSSQLGAPIESITPRKQKRIALATMSWLELLEGRRFPLRFDVVEVFLSTGELPVLRHTANAFDLPRHAVY